MSWPGSWDFFEKIAEKNERDFIVPKETYSNLDERGRYGRMCECLKLEDQGGNSQNFLRKFVRFFVIFRCFYNKISHEK